MVELFDMVGPDKWVSVIGTTARSMRPLDEAEASEVVRLLAESGHEVDTRRSGTAFMLRA